ncbi:hypothetical protein NPX13_g5341 [Xylaria arbuscula]|uniref:NACHT domain-containing protein n=1 Tax=Xylaria arbuscula TaxID=114810 RepID=A0A9W8TMH8_9PEZI|nr:hypothetical protein NPX13_g5341 [Xylaria arbuscula]
MTTTTARPTVETDSHVGGKIISENARSVGYEEYVEALDLEISDKEMRKVRIKIDAIVVPIFLITQGLQFLDRTALNYANLFGYQTALNLKGQEFNYLSAMIYAGYFFGQYPCGWLIGRYPAQRVVSVCILIWGVLVLLLTQARTFSTALAIRCKVDTTLSLANSHSQTTGLTLMTGFWFTRQEIPLLQCIWYSSLGWGGIIGSYISLGIARLPGNVTPKRWQIIFYILGGLTTLWAPVVWFVLADSPSNAKFLNHREKLIAVKRVAGNETGIKNKHLDIKQVWLVFKDPKAILLFISVFAAAIPNGVVNSFSTIIIKDLGDLSTEKTTELKSVGDAVNIVALLIGGTIILNVPDSRLLTATAANLLCTLVNAQSVGFTISLTTVSSNMAGYTHRSFASALIFTAYCWGNFAGPFVVKQSEAPAYTGALIGLLVGYSIKFVCHLLLLERRVLAVVHQASNTIAWKSRIAANALARSMSSVITNLSRLKPELRLAQAVSEFEAALSDQQKATFRSYRSQSQASPPDAGHFMRLTAEIDRLSAGKTRGGRCFGPRLSNILQSTQQFAACGDVAIGGTQNVIAGSVWSLVRITLLVMNFSVYFDKLSTLLMAIGRSAPRYQTLALLYHQSKELRSYLYEYFTVIVRLFHAQFKLLQKSTFGQFMSISFLSEADLKAYQSDCEFWASSIKEEVNKLTATDTVEQSFRTKALLKFSDSESLRKKHNAFLHILNSCSTFNYEKAWKETRKIGYTTLLNQSLEYQHWKVQPDSGTLVCSGKLGSGKSVLLANMVDDLYLHAQNEGLPVAYFFCQHDNPQSLEARTIMGCLARQLLCSTRLPSGLDDFADTTSPAVDIDGVVDLLVKVLPSRAYFIIDGLDECNDRQRQILGTQLRRLQGSSSLLVCLSIRHEAENALRVYLEQFMKTIVFQIPDNNTDIEEYITAELERRIESEKSKLGNPTLILEIRDALLQGAQGMFLWVALQIESLCAAKTDMAIRQALADLPRDLPARRPLTTDELREALSVVPGNTDWVPAQILNDVYSALACCGSLIIIEEEDATVRLVHHSVKQFLLGGLQGRTSGIFTLDSAMGTMGAIIVTYLNYGVFDTQLSTKVVPQVIAGTAPTKIVHSALDGSKNVMKAALWLLRSRKKSEYNIGNILVDEGRLFNAHSTNQFNFFPYAQSYWFQHIKSIPREEQVTHRLLLELLRGSIIDTKTREENGQTPLCWAAADGYEAVVQLLLDKGANFDRAAAA